MYGRHFERKIIIIIITSTRHPSVTIVAVFSTCFVEPKIFGVGVFFFSSWSPHKQMNTYTSLVWFRDVTCFYVCTLDERKSSPPWFFFFFITVTNSVVSSSSRKPMATSRASRTRRQQQLRDAIIIIMFYRIALTLGARPHQWKAVEVWPSGAVKTPNEERRRRRPSVRPRRVKIVTRTHT